MLTWACCSARSRARRWCELWMERDEGKGEKKMANYLATVEVKDGEVKAILDRLAEAQKEIWECYRALEDLGVLVIKKEADSGN